LIEEDDKITHDISLEEDLEPLDEFNQFKVDLNYE